MEKEENQKTLRKQTSKNSRKIKKSAKIREQKKKNEQENKEEIKKKVQKKKLLELEDKLARTFAEMENQRRRFEKEKEDAFEYGGYIFCKRSIKFN